MSQLNCDNNTISSETFEDLDSYAGKAARRPKPGMSVSHREKSARILGSLANEISKKAFTKDLQNFKLQGGLFQQKEIVCERNKVSLRFSSPLDQISWPNYIKRFKCDELISEHESNTDKSNKKSTSSSVLAVKLNWRRGVKIEQVSMYTRRTRMIEPEMTQTDFDFETKTKFQKQFQSTCDLLFPEKNVMILDGNECHGHAIKSRKVQEDKDEEETTEADRNMTTFTDSEEHQILLVPYNSKSGFDSDVSQRYKFPYHAKFSIGNKTFEHKFDLKLALSQSPQHYGLVFSFPVEGSNGQNVLKIKSLLTVFSVFPSSSRYASLSTYTAHPLTNDRENTNSSSGKSKSNKKSFANNLTGTVTSKLTETSATVGACDGGKFSINCPVSHPNNPASRGKNSWLDQGQVNHKSKQRLLQSIKSDVRENVMGPVRNK